MAPRDDKLTLVVRKIFRASAEFLFDAWTDPKRMAAWFHAQADWTTEVVEADLRVGGAWKIVMHGAEGPTCLALGRYVEIDRPRRLAFTWHPNGERDYETLVTLSFRVLGPDSTELVLTQSGFREEKDRTEHQHGWDGCLTSLARLVDTRSS